jgi:DNA helicase-2/ATP-dependent DNA helicase PcrA
LRLRKFNPIVNKSQQSQPELLVSHGSECLYSSGVCGGFAMEIALELMQDYQELNDRQREIVSHDGSPLLIIAGPGSGKTRSLTLLAMNLLLLEKATPSELILCTYTEKAAREMQDRIIDIAKRANYKKDISQMRIGTIHSICNRFIMEHLHRIPFLGNNYETLDYLSQRLFIFSHLSEICKPDPRFLMNRLGTTQWDTAKRLQNFFEKITEELIDLNALISSEDCFLAYLAQSYRAYVNLLSNANRVDFAHLQKIVYDLLLNKHIASHLTKGIRYVLVDEYQDTNYIQEQILLKLASETGNMYVVGDENQALYRFRGATVRNIHQFHEHFSNCKVIYLTTNYRSHPKIIDASNRWMTSSEWNHDGYSFRHEKTIQPDPGKRYSNYPATLTIVGQDIHDEAYRFAEFITFLKEQGIITDYNQVALLMYSVRSHKSDVYIKALEERGIPAFCSRAGTYTDQKEVRLMVGCLARIFGYYLERQANFGGLGYMAKYVKECTGLTSQQCQVSKMLDATLQEQEAEIMQLPEEHKLDKRPMDYFYLLLATEPFATFVKDENKRRNLVIFSQLLNTFQHYYFSTSGNSNNYEQLRSHLFTSFLCLLYDDRIHQYDNPDQAFPKGHVQVMTIHQAKGLEFPVIVVAGLDRQLPESGLEDVDDRLQRFYRRGQFEPEELIPRFDFMRLYYVAFSRAMNLLVLTANRHKKPNALFYPFIRGSARWSGPHADLPLTLSFSKKEWIAPKPRYSFTGHIKMYETCPRQYQFFQEYNFTPSHSPETFFGLLVHQTIEKIHRIVLDGRFADLSELKIRDLFDETFSSLICANLNPIDALEKEKAYIQVMNYFFQNQSEICNLINAEESINIVQDGYVLTGKIDVLLRRNGKLEVLDFKTSRRPSNDSELLDVYERQLCMYAYALEQRDGIRPERLLLYWTGEPRKEDALMVFPYRLKYPPLSRQKWTQIKSELSHSKNVVNHDR